MRSYKEHLILSRSTVKQALGVLNELSQDAILFVVDENNKLIGSLTDGDVRRGLLNNFNLDAFINEIIQPNPRYIRKGQYDIQKIIEYRDEHYRLIPVLDNNDVVINVINFRFIKSYLPIDAVIMAGGRGQRLQPLTDVTPKPLLKVGDKPIMEHNLNRLAMFGIDDFWVSVKYLGEQIEEHLASNPRIKFVKENKPLGTIGAVSKIDDLNHKHILITNSDILTNLEYEQFYLDYKNSNADLSIAAIPYKVNIPYAVLEKDEDGIIKGFREKPTYTYYSNGGIYLIKKSILSKIPKNKFFNSTDLMELILEQNLNLISYSTNNYWLDIGSHEDFKKAKRDINNRIFQ